MQPAQTQPFHSQSSMPIFLKQKKRREKIRYEWKRRKNKNQPTKTP